MKLSLKKQFDHYIWDWDWHCIVLAKLKTNFDRHETYLEYVKYYYHNQPGSKYIKI